MDKTFVIAEAGSNHNGSIETAKNMIDVAADAGADAVKFQIFKSDMLYSRETPDFAGHHNVPELIRSLEFDRNWAQELKDYCDARQIEFMATPFDEEAIKLLVNLGVKRMKVAGFEASDPRFVRAVTATGLPTIISLGSGLCSSDIYTILCGVNPEHQKKITFLHCNNAYPTPDQDANLRELERIKIKAQKYFLSYGLSDHTRGVLAPAMAVAMGATVIEKHFTLDRTMKGPDHAHAIEPPELKKMIYLIRQAEVLMGGNKSGYTDSEVIQRYARRSVVATRDIKIGEFLNETNITTKRPFLDGAIPAGMYYQVLNTATVLKPIRKDAVILLEDIA